MDDMSMSGLRLSFPGELEQRFRDDFYFKSLAALRLSLLLGAVIYSLFGILDVVLSPQTRTAVWIVRYGIACPAILACLLFTYSSHFRKYMQPAVFCTVVTGGGAIVAMMIIVGSPINYFHNAGLVLVLMYTYTFSKLRFAYTTLASWIIVLTYEAAALFAMKTPLPAFLSDNFLFISANLIGMFSHYHRERYMRRDFLNNQTVRELEEKRNILEREKILRDLHDGLGGIITNIRLLAEMGKKALSPEENRKTLNTISALSGEGLAEIKGFMQSLDAAEITWQALVAEIRMRGRSVVEPHGFAFSFTTSLEIPAEPPRSLLWLNLQRVYREALTNVVKHSGGKNVAVDLNIGRDRLVLSITDDGKGILPDGSAGRGLANMRKRAEEIGAAVVFENSRGTRVSLAIPLPVAYETREKNREQPLHFPGIKANDRRKSVPAD